MIKGTQRVWIIGLDGATFELIKPWARQGELPTFAYLLEKGAHGSLRSPIPQSPPAWASFMTGKNPGKHGIYEFVQPRQSTYAMELTNGASCRAETLWSRLSRHGRRVGAMNVPMTFPPEPVNGFLISGFDTPFGNTNFTYPPELYDEIQARFGQYTFFPVITEIPLSRVIENYHATINLRERVMNFLLESHRLDLFMMVFNATDSTQHLCLQSYDQAVDHSEQMAALLSIYKRLDRFLADILGRLPADVSLMVVSDHGGGPLRAYVNLDHWLAEQGWLCYASDDPRTASRRRRMQWLAKGITAVKSLVPRLIKRRLRRVKKLRVIVDEVLTLPRLDWKHTRAYTFTSQGIYINLRGRQPQGIVEPGDEYEALRDQISAALLALKDPETGMPVVAQVYKKEAFFSGPFVDVAPDLYIHWKDDAYLSWSNDEQPKDQIFRRPDVLRYDDVVPAQPKSATVGCHRQEGIFLLYGDAAQPGQVVDGAQLVDIFPTVLALMGESIPEDLDGRVLTDALKRSYLEAHPVEYTGNVGVEAEISSSDRFVYSTADEEAVEQRLRELGYL